MRSRVWFARGGRAIAGVENQVVKAAQDEASPDALRRKTPEAQNLLLAKREGVLWRNLPEVNDAGCVRPCDSRAKAIAAVGELTKSAENKTNNSVRLGSIPCAVL
jgi:hypothetical protein